MSQQIDPKLLKVVALAKDGIGGEKTTALKIVKRICAEKNLDFDDVMNGTEIVEYVLDVPYRSAAEQTVLRQIVVHFALTQDNQELFDSPKHKMFMYKTTPAKHIETLNAAAVYLRAFRAERKKFLNDLTDAYIHKHSLYPQFEVDAKKKTPKEPLDLDKIRRQLSLASNMDDVNVRKQIGK